MAWLHLVLLRNRIDLEPDSALSVLMSDVAAELGGQIVDGVDSRSCLHGGQPVQKSPVALCHHLHEEDLQQDLGKLLADAHPGAASKRDVLEPAGVARRFAQEALGPEVLFVGEHLGHVVRVADAVDDVPAFGDLVTLRRDEPRVSTAVGCWYVLLGRLVDLRSVRRS